MKHLFISALLAFILIVSFGAATAHAATAPVTGYVWSSNIGWIQLDTGVLNPVTIDTATGIWAGYAWSSNIGWILFNSNGCGAQATVNLMTGTVTGWAKALSADGNGWDGCIELSGTNHTSPVPAGTGGVTYNNSDGTFVGYAWGGSVVGWVQFNTGSANPAACPTCGTGAPPITSVSCAPSSLVTGDSPININYSATVTGGQNPQYSWDGGSTWGASGTFSKTYIYPAGLKTGPDLWARNGSDNASKVQASPNRCANASVNPLTADNSNIQIGRDLAGLRPGGVTLPVSPGAPFVIKWNVILSDDYTATVSIDPVGAASNPGLAGWTNAVVNNSAVSDAAGKTITWDGASGNTTTGNGGTTMTAGTAGNPLAPGLYQFTITFTSSIGGATQTATAKLRVTSSSETEI